MGITGLDHTPSPRLLTKFEDIKTDLETSYASLAKYLMEMKMDLNDGTKACDRLKEFLGNNGVMSIMLSSKIQVHFKCMHAHMEGMLMPMIDTGSICHQTQQVYINNSYCEGRYSNQSCFSDEIHVQYCAKMVSCHILVLVISIFIDILIDKRNACDACMCTCLLLIESALHPTSYGAMVIPADDSDEWLTELLKYNREAIWFALS